VLNFRAVAVLGSLAIAALTSANAAEPVKIGLITTLSTPLGYLGEEIKRGFELAVQQEDGKLGGIPVKLLIADDALNPNVASELATRMLQSDRVKIFSGTVASPITLSLVPRVLDAGGYFISTNSAPIAFDGEHCHPRYFVASWHNTGQFEAAVASAAANKVKRAVLIAARFNGGLEALESWKALYKETIVDEILVKLNQTDFAGEISQLKLSRPEAIFTFLPGGMGTSFLRQLHQAGLRNIAVYPGFTVDSLQVQAVGDAALGAVGSTFWNDDFDNSANVRFVSDYQRAFGRVPTNYAAQGYDAARLIGSALNATGGDVDETKFRSALREAKFESVRGSFSFDIDQHPIQDWVATAVSKTPSGEYRIKTVAKVITQHRPPLATQCKMAP
jgi:branched-chain amino acid transport system substrate-binding protein